MIDNTLKIEGLMSFDKDDFYFVQLIKRRKDNPLQKRSEITIKSYYINSFDELHDLMVMIRNTCDFENARAYIRLNKRNYKDLGMKVLNRALTYVSSNNNKPLCNVFDAVAGEHHSDPIKKWLIDVDDVWCKPLTSDALLTNHLNKIIVGGVTFEMEELIRVLKQLQSETGKKPIMEYIPSKTGLHIITRPFNLKKFKQLYPDMSVHKDATTLLYCP